MVWLIYQQSECQEEEFFVNFFCASENVSYFILSVRFSGPSLAPEGRGISEPPQLLGDHLFTAHSLPLTFEDYWLVLGQWRCIGVRRGGWQRGLEPSLYDRPS